MKNLLKLIFLHTPLLLFGLVYYGVKFVLKYPKEYERLRLENKRILENLNTPKQQAKQESKAIEISTILDRYIEACIKQDGVDYVLANGIEIPYMYIKPHLKHLRPDSVKIQLLPDHHGYQYHTEYGAIKIFIQKSGGFVM